MLGLSWLEGDSEDDNDKSEEDQWQNVSYPKKNNDRMWLNHLKHKVQELNEYVSFVTLSHMDWLWKHQINHKFGLFPNDLQVNFFGTGPANLVFNEKGPLSTFCLLFILSSQFCVQLLWFIKLFSVHVILI